MTIHENDPKLTAYALGELDGAERAEVEAAIADNPALFAEVEAIRATAALVETELAADAATTLTAAHRATIEHALGQHATMTLHDDAHGVTPFPPPLRLRHVIPAALAACLLLAVGVAYERFYEPTPLGLVACGPGFVEPGVGRPIFEGIDFEGDQFADARGSGRRGYDQLARLATRFDELNSRPDGAAAKTSAIADEESDAAGGAAAESMPFDIFNETVDDALGDGVAAGDVNLDGLASALGGDPWPQLPDMDPNTAWNADIDPNNNWVARRQERHVSLVGKGDGQSAALVDNPRDATGEGRERYWAWSQSAPKGPLDSPSLGLVLQRTNDDENLEGRPPQQRAYPFQFDPLPDFDPAALKGDWTSTVADYVTPGERFIDVDGDRRWDGVEMDRHQLHMDPSELAGRSDLMFGLTEVAEPFRDMEYVEAHAAAGLHSLGYLEAVGKSLSGARFYGFDPTTRASYAPATHNPFKRVADEPLSTFSIDVDTAAYANVRRYLNDGLMPPPDAVRVEEMVNYFNYDYPIPDEQHPFSVTVDVAEAPWKPQHRLVRIGLKGYEMTYDQRPASNLVFLLDVSGSMEAPNKIDLVKESLRMFVAQLDQYDRVAMVVYAGASGLVLDSTTADNQQVILDALERLESGGSTNGGAGIELAYTVAMDNFIEGGTNRVILATDGDFNVGTTGQGELQRLIEEKAKTGVFLSVLGFGFDNLQDDTLETLADKGNGNYAYIDTLGEARKVLVDQMDGTINTIAKDVKIQVEFNPAAVAAYRLIGYENRVLANQDFNDDTKDAGEIGAGHTVTALYEVVPAGLASEPDVAAGLPVVDPLKYQEAKELAPAAGSGELLTVKLRYKEPDGDVSQLIEKPVVDAGLSLAEASPDFTFAAAVASFGMILRGSPHAGDATYDFVYELAQAGVGDDPFGYRAEFLGLVESARNIARLLPEGE